MSLPGPPVQPSRRRVRFNDAWLFRRGDADGAEAIAFDDACWTRLDLPHDWAVEGPFDRTYGPDCGGLPCYGIGWYRKHFTVSDERNTLHRIEFDGAMANARVWLNGEELGSRPYGYASFAFDLTPHLRPSWQDNVLAVRVAPEDGSSRWYTGAGINRNVWLTETNRIHIAHWGTSVTTPTVSDDEALVSVRTEVCNRGDRSVTATMEAQVIAQSGSEAGRAASAPAMISIGQTRTLEAAVRVPRPDRWNFDHPVIYQAKISVFLSGVEVDHHVTPFGIRTIAFDPKQGFVLNERRVPLKGVCLHEDYGALGTAVNRRAIERQLQTMKAMGANAIRASHNPPAPELLDAADRFGLLVVVEAFDEWKQSKVQNGYGKYFDEWSERDLRDMVRRDRNHPCIVLWSIGNEVLEQADPAGREVARRLVGIVREEDSTRPVTAGFNQIDNAINNGLVQEVDVVGLNYGAPSYKQIVRKHPDWIVLGTETASTVSSRGTYHLPVEKYEKHPSRRLTSYDLIAPPWAYPPDVEFDMLDRLPSIAGEFAWAGSDYLGEPTPYFGEHMANCEDDWPARSSYFGIVDLAGFPKDRYYLYQSHWSDEPMVHVLPHWSWDGHEGRPIPVFVYTNLDEAELFLNGRSYGRKKRGKGRVAIPVGRKVNRVGRFKSRYRLAWSVPWSPGVLTVVGSKPGYAPVIKEIRSAGPPARLGLAPDRTCLSADGEDLSFITVRIEDKDNGLCPLAENLVTFEIDGAASIAAVDNGDSATTEPFRGNSRHAFAGLALLVIRTERGHAGRIMVSAAATGLEPSSVELTSL
jgi:beta-galactosidase